MTIYRACFEFFRLRKKSDLEQSQMTVYDQELALNAGSLSEACKNNTSAISLGFLALETFVPN
jgi:hypothetical protein